MKNLMFCRDRVGVGVLVLEALGKVPGLAGPVKVLVVSSVLRAIEDRLSTAHTVRLEEVLPRQVHVHHEVQVAPAVTQAGCRSRWRGRLADALPASRGATAALVP